MSKLINLDVHNEDGSYLTNEQAFVNRINNILNISLDTIPFSRDLGNRLEYYLHRPYNIVTFSLIEIELLNVLKRYFDNIEITVEKHLLDYTNRVYPITINIRHPLLDGTLIIKKRFQSYE